MAGIGVQGNIRHNTDVNLCFFECPNGRLNKAIAAIAFLCGKGFAGLWDNGK